MRPPAVSRPLLAVLAVGLSATAHAAPPVALTDALDYRRDAGRLNLVVDWKRLEAAGVSRDTPVPLTLSKVSVRTALRKTLEAAAPGLLTFYVDGGVVHVTTLSAADEVLLTRVYAVGDLLVDVPDFEGPELGLSGRGGRGGGGGGGGLFGNAATTVRGEGRTRAERAAALVELIQATVRPEVWSVNGGRATVRFFHDNLIITAPPSVHAQLG